MLTALVLTPLLPAGLPVLAPRESDIANFVSADALFADEDEMADKLARLLSDEDFRLARARAQQRHLVRENTADAYARHLLAFAVEVRRARGWDD
mgnify:CR=1 FL=1